MAKYNWTNETIRERYMECIELWYKETNPTLKESYFRTARNLQNFLESKEETKASFPLLESYNFEKENLSQREFLWSLYQEFAKVNSKPILNIPNLKNTTLSPKDILELTYDFYKGLDPFIFKHFMQNFHMRKDHIRFVNSQSNNDFAGINIVISHRCESFIEVVSENTINDVITTIHEYGHTTSYIINPFNKCTPNFYFTEVITLFFELIGADYLGKLFGNDESIILKADNHNTMSDFANITSNKIDLFIGESLLTNGYTKNEDLKNLAKELVNLDSEKLEDLFKNENVETDDYVIGYIIAIELYYIYLEDKDKAMYILKKMLLYKAKSELDYYNNLKRLGIIPNQHIHEYVTTLQSDVLTLSRKHN